MTRLGIASVALLAAVLHPSASLAALSPSNAAVAARIAGQLRCQTFAYYPGASSASGSKGELDCQVRRQHFTVYVFPSNRLRAHGIAHLKLWSGPEDVYHFAKDTRAIIVPRGAYPKPGYTKKWARIAARRTGGAVFSG